MLTRSIDDIQVGRRFRHDFGDIDGLAKSIADVGLLHPIVIRPDGRLIAGCRRLKACRTLGWTKVPVHVVDLEGIACGEYAENTIRKDFTAGEAAAIHEALLPVEREQAAKRQQAARQAQDERGREGGRGKKKTLPGKKTGRVSEAGRSRTRAAKATGYSATTLAKIDAVKRAAREDGGTFGDLWHRMEIAERGEVNRIYQQYKRLVAQLAREAQSRQQALRAEVTRANWREWLAAQPPCDLLLTDPPYSTEVPDIRAFAADWLPVALSKVRATGRAYICVGAYPDELLAYLMAPRGEMILAQILVWSYSNTLGPKPKFDYRANWQAVLYFRGHDAAPLDCPDLNEQGSVHIISAPDGRQEGRYHRWEKPEALAERFVRHATAPGALVLDPFMGTGTFLLAAARLGRVARGCDLDQTQVDLAIRRGCQHA